MNADFNPVHYAREEIAPLLRSLCDLAEAEGEPEQSAYFLQILESLERCVDGTDLADPLMGLSTAAFRGLHYSPVVALMLDQALEKAQLLSESLSVDEGQVH